jgi:hypothetical protein
VRQPEPNRDSEAFLSALADELSISPDDLTTTRQVEAAAAAARSARNAVRSHVTRWAVAALAFTTLFGTGGIAVAGGLPAPLQVVVADVARALPVPFHVPYPHVPTQGLTANVADHADQVPEEVEVETAPEEVINATSPRPETSADESEVDAIDPDPTRDGDDDRARCDLEHLVEDRDRFDAQEVRERRDQIRQVCSSELVDPPGWAQGSLTAEERDGDRRDRNEDRRDDQDRDGDAWGRDEDWREEERGEGDRDRDDKGGYGDFGSSESEDSDEASQNASDEEEERHDDEDDGDDRSSDDEWRDRHD